jgi:protein-L-isoaspartate(D-aspartate) O-methyltransferase
MCDKCIEENPRMDRYDTTDSVGRRQALVDQLVQAGSITTPTLEAAFRAVPRHHFLPDVALDLVYHDMAIPTKFEDGIPISSSSQPAMMAVMLAQLDLQPGQRVLEIGTGTGYNAALLATLVGERGQVVTVDIDHELAAMARMRLATAGYDAVQVIGGDGGQGYAALAPYDRIVVTAGAWDVAPAWREQLTAAGQLVLPLSLYGPQQSIAFARDGGELVSRSVRACGFMRLRGAFRGQETELALGPESGLVLHCDEPPPVDAATVAAWLRGPSMTLSIDVQTQRTAIWRSLSLTIATQLPGYCLLNATGAVAEQRTLPALFRWQTGVPSCSSIGVVSAHGLCLLSWDADPAAVAGEADDATFPLMIVHFGSDPTLAERLAACIAAWDADGQGAGRQLHIRATPHDHAGVPPSDATIIDRTWHRLLLTWQRDATHTAC